MRLYSVILVLLLIGCKAKTSYVEKTETKETTELQLPTESQLTVESLCDTLGQPAQLDKVITSKLGTVRLKIEGNELFFNIANDTIVVSRDKEVTSSKESVEVRYAWNKFTWYLVIGLGATILIFIIFYRVPETINKIVRRLLGIPF